MIAGPGLAPDSLAFNTSELLILHSRYGGSGRSRTSDSGLRLLSRLSSVLPLHHTAHGCRGGNCTSDLLVMSQVSCYCTTLLG